MPAKWTETREIPLDELTPFPGNARRGDVAAIVDSIERNGQYRSLVVRETGGALVVLAGNHTRAALSRLGREAARCEVIRCSDAEARRINLADNRTAELGDYDDKALADLLSGLEGDFEGTGWSAGDLDDLLKDLDNLDADEDGARPNRGELLALAGVTVGEPRHQPEPGQVWALGGHRLAVADVFTGHMLWAPLLEEGAVFLPYPTPLVPHAPAYDGLRLVMVQPEPYLAGHLLDKWEDITGTPPAVTVEAAG